MARWEPDAGGRLREAAVELFCEQGYEATTIAEIAGRAGLTARTFFRHYTDKREVLFAGSAALEAAMVTALAGAPEGASPRTAVAAALAAAAEMLRGNREFSRLRWGIISSHAELRERELIKLATLAAALAAGLRQRGVDEPAASLVAETGVAAFRVAFERWVGDEEAELGAAMQDALDRIGSLLAPEPAPAS